MVSYVISHSFAHNYLNDYSIDRYYWALICRWKTRSMSIIAFVTCKYDREPMSLNYIYIYICVYPFLKVLPRPLSWISNHRRYTIEALLRNNFAYFGGPWRSLICVHWKYHYTLHVGVVLINPTVTLMVFTGCHTAIGSVWRAVHIEALNTVACILQAPYLTEMCSCKIYKITDYGVTWLPDSIGTMARFNDAYKHY